MILKVRRGRSVFTYILCSCAPHCAHHIWYFNWDDFTLTTIYFLLINFIYLSVRHRLRVLVRYINFACWNKCATIIVFHGSIFRGGQCVHNFCVIDVRANSSPETMNLLRSNRHHVKLWFSYEPLHIWMLKCWYISMTARSLALKSTCECVCVRVVFVHIN